MRRLSFITTAAALSVLITASCFARPFGLSSKSALDRKPLARDKTEGRILKTIEEMAKGAWHANVSFTDGRLLRQLTEAVNAKVVVELGTASGFSALWLAMALSKTGGKLYTHEISPKMVKLARKNFRKAGVDKIVTIVEGDAHQTISQHRKPIDVLFLDADKRGYVKYLKKLLPLVKPGGLILAHNMRVPRVDPAYHKAITSDPKLETTFLLMQGAGISLTLKKR